jgi:prepilin-type N-terminal cleavage/methylation domain-containing protein
MRAAAPDGYSLVEVACAVAILATLGSIAIPPMLATVDEFRTSGAARHVAARLQRARMDAVLRSASVGLQVTQTGAGYSYAVYVDGNRNGVRTIEIQQGTDRALVPPERLADQFPGVEFGAIPGLPAVDAGGTPPGTDPVRLGSGNLATFSPIGTSSSGTLYIRGRRDTQCAVRLYGQTGKVRVLKFDARSRQWVPL